MKTLHRVACIVILASALTAACGGDDNNKSASSTTAFSPSTSAVVSTTPNPGGSTPTSATAGTIVQGVTDGAVCSPAGARGVTRDGLAMMCANVGGETRWRPA